MSKQEQYRLAMEKFERHVVYRNLGTVVAAVIVLLQIVGLVMLPWGEASLAWILLFLLAYVLADFINGLIHMVMDNADDYTSVIGPLVAAFHQHHHVPKYRDRPAALVFLAENGMKNWLAVYMILLIVVLHHLPPAWAFLLLAFSLLSSLAELSHYLCHNSTHRFVRVLQSMRILLHPDHHRVHHEADNTHYAFLNGMTNSLVNWIAKRVYPSGYVETTDAHSAPYFRKSP
jgi:sterol desaturase/sphingolipid hydroxylase (fatty acid hydroxylase superfamily)